MEATNKDNYPKTHYVIPLAIISLLSLLLYGYSLWCSFVWDDIVLVITPLQLGNNPYSFFLDSGIYYRPVLHLSMALDFSLWHLNPLGFHLTNNILHMINSLLVFAVALHLLKGASNALNAPGQAMNASRKAYILPLLSALIFTFHPIHTESVAWVSGRTDLLSTLFLLLAFLSFLLYHRDGERPALVLSSLFFIFSLMSKENGIALIGLVLAYGVMTKMPREKLLLSLASLSISLVIYLFLRAGGGAKEFIAQPGSQDAFFLPGMSFTTFFKTLILGAGFYFEKLLLPFNLNLMPQLPTSPLYLLFFILPFTAAAVLYYQKNKTGLFLISWIIITLLPSLTILFSQIAAPLGERYLYLPSVGFSILFAAGLYSVLSHNKKVMIGLLMVILCIYSLTTIDRLKVWKNDLTLWEDTTMKSPDLPNTHTSYAAALLRDGQKTKARDELLRALSLKKLSFEQLSKSLELLGMVEMEERNYELAEEYLQKAIISNNKSATAYNNLGVLYMTLSESNGTDKKKAFLHKAIQTFNDAIRVSPSFIQPLYNLGICHLGLVESEKAEHYFNAVIASDPQSDISQRAQQMLLLIQIVKKAQVSIGS